MCFYTGRVRTGDFMVFDIKLGTFRGSLFHKQGKRLNTFFRGALYSDKSIKNTVLMPFWQF